MPRMGDSAVKSTSPGASPSKPPAGGGGEGGGSEGAAVDGKDELHAAASRAARRERPIARSGNHPAPNGKDPMQAKAPGIKELFSTATLEFVPPVTPYPKPQTPSPNLLSTATLEFVPPETPNPKFSKRLALQVWCRVCCSSRPTPDWKDSVYGENTLCGDCNRLVEENRQVADGHCTGSGG